MQSARAVDPTGSVYPTDIGNAQLAALELCLIHRAVRVPAIQLDAPGP